MLGAAAAATLVLAGTDVGIVAALRAHGALPLTGADLRGLGGRLDRSAAWSTGPLHRPISPLVLLLWLALLTVPVGLAADARGC